MDGCNNPNSECDLLNRLLELRNAAKACSNAAYADVLRASSDWLQTCITRLAADATTENMVSLNGAWARAERVLNEVPPEAEPTPPQSVAEEMRMAA